MGFGQRHAEEVMIVRKQDDISKIQRMCWNADVSHRQAGFSLFELVVVGCIVAVLAYFMLHGINFVQARAEQRAFEDKVAALQSALNYEAMSRNARGESQRVAELASKDPFEWLQATPPAYSEQFSGASPSASAGWYYDRKANQVVYVPKMPERLQVAANARKEIRLRVEVQANGSSVRLVAVQPFSWH